MLRIEQNTAYYELIIERHFGGGPPLTNLSAHMIERARRRYRLTAPSAELDAAWALMVDSVYAQEPSVQDTTGVPHLRATGTWSFGTDRATP